MQLRIKFCAIRIIVFMTSVFFTKSLLAQKITFSEHIAPIIFNKCSPCHSPEHGTPFSYLNYEDIKAKGKMIKNVVLSGYMPPWKADTSYTHFANERILSLKEKQLLISWIESGMPKGNGKLPVYTPVNNNFVIADKPDIILKMKTPIFIKGNNKESFPVVKIPYEFKTDSAFLNVKCIEFVPGNKKLLHHVNYQVIPAQENEDIFKGPYMANYISNDSSQIPFNRYDSLNVDYLKSVYYGGWLPGLSPLVYGDDFGIRLPKKGVILIDVMHISASPVDDFDDSYFKIYLKKNKVERVARWDVMGSGGSISEIEPPLIIPADSIKKFKTTFRTLFDISVMFINPHMHLLGKSFIAFAITPFKDTIPLIKINNWDFNWQEFYALNPMIYLPAGTIIVAEGVFDNTSNNPHNPFNPPRLCTSVGLMRTIDEMLGFGLMFFDYKEGDETKIIKLE